MVCDSHPLENSHGERPNSDRSRQNSAQVSQDAEHPQKPEPNHDRVTALKSGEYRPVPVSLESLSNPSAMQRPDTDVQRTAIVTR